MRRSLGPCLTALFLGALCNVAAGEEIIASYNHLQAVAPEKFVCSDSLRVTVRADSADAFGGDRRDLLQLLNGIKTRLSFDCPKTENVLIEGQVGGRLAYRGAISRDTRWALVDLTPALAAGPSSNSPSGLSLKGYKFPGLIAAIYDGRFDDVPDDTETRSLATSIFKIFADNCANEATDVAMAATLYASENVRRVNRGEGLQVLGDYLQDLEQGRNSGDLVGTIQTLTDKYAVLVREGLDDGTLFVSQYQCGSDVQSRFDDNLGQLIVMRSRDEPKPMDDIVLWSLMSPEYRQQHNIPDPTVELAKRKTVALKGKAQAACETRFDRPGFCTCAIKGLEAAGFGDANWETLGADFRSVATLGKDRADVLSAVRACYKPPT